MPSESKLGVLKFESCGNVVRLKCNAMATLYLRGETSVYLLSVAGPSSAVKAVAAGLNSDAKATYKPEDMDGLYSWRDVRRPKETKFRIYRTKLGECNVWHMLAIADTVGLIPNFNEEAFWRYLTSEEITTPILREWVPYLLHRMSRHLILLDSFGCDAVIVPPCQNVIDQYVSEGVVNGDISLPGWRNAMAG